MDVAFLITTYNRQESCQRLVDALQGYGDIYVLNDGCDYDIKGAKQSKLREHLGRSGYWRTVNCLFRGRGNHKYYFMLPDDFLPADGMVEKAITLWNSIKDPQKICLNLYADRIGIPCWTGFKQVDKGNVYLRQWVDMCFLCEDKFFTELGELTDTRGNWQTKGSSGVGAMISKRLKRKEFNLYQVKESLVEVQEEHHKSQMYNQNDKNSWSGIRAVTQRTFDTRNK